MDKKFEIGITTTGDTSGVDKVKEATEDLKQTLEGAGDAGTNDILEASIGNIPTELEEVQRLLKETRQELDVLTEGSDDFKTVEKAVLQLETGLEDLAEQARKADKEFEDIATRSKKATGELGKLGKEADSTADDLKQIAALETAAALQEAVSGAKAAGEQLVILRDQVSASNGSFGETAGIVQTGIGAVTQFATAARAAYLALGPLGIALAVIATALAVAAAAFDDTAERADQAAAKQKTAIEKNAEAALKAIQTSRDQQEAGKNLSRVLDGQRETYKNLGEEISAATEKRRLDQRLQDELADRQLAFELTKIDRNDDLSEVEKIEARGKLRLEALQRTQEAERKSREADIKTQEAEARKAQEFLATAEQSGGIGEEQKQRADALEVKLVNLEKLLERSEVDLKRDVAVIEKERGSNFETAPSFDDFINDSRKLTTRENFDKSFKDGVDSGLPFLSPLVSGAKENPVEAELDRAVKTREFNLKLEQEILKVKAEQESLEKSSAKNLDRGKEAEALRKEVEQRKAKIEELQKEAKQKEAIAKIDREEFLFVTRDDRSNAKEAETKATQAADDKAKKEADAQAKKDESARAKAESEAQKELSSNLPAVLDEAGVRQRFKNAGDKIARNASNGLQGDELERGLNALVNIATANERETGRQNNVLRSFIQRVKRLEDQSKNGDKR